MLMLAVECIRDEGIVGVYSVVGILGVLGYITECLSMASSSRVYNMSITEVNQLILYRQRIDLLDQ